ncbi:MAG: hypothetical protein WCJ39_01880 [bacterium]
METSIIETKKMVNLFLSNPTENFNSLQYDKLALSLVYQKIESKGKKELIDFLKSSFNEDNLKNLYYGSFGGLKKEVYQLISEFKKPLEEWISFYFYSFQGLKEITLIKLKSVDDYSFDGWQNMLSELEKFNKNEYTGKLWPKITDEEFEEIKSLILSKMDEQAKTIEHWGYLYKKSDGTLREKAFNKIEELI